MGFLDFLKGDANTGIESTAKIVDVWVDKNTGLMWELDISRSLMTWNEANVYAETMNSKMYCGYSDWRLPTIEELEWVYKYKNLDIAWKYKEKGVNATDFSNLFYWSSNLLRDRVEKILDLTGLSERHMVNMAWNICITNAIAGYDDIRDKQCLRLVRG